jgi:hypothetical protein
MDGVSTEVRYGHFSDTTYKRYDSSKILLQCDLRGDIDLNQIFELSKTQDYFLRFIIPCSSETAPDVSPALKIEAIYPSETSGSELHSVTTFFF